MEAVELAYALAAGADFTGAQLDRVEMTGGAQLQSANFLVASLRGADLTGAHLQGAGFGTAAMQGAILRHADLRGADLRDADLEAADLQRARLEGAQLTGAQLRAADLRWTGIWMTRPPAEGSVVLADISAARIAPPSAADDNLASLTEPLETPRARAELEERLAGLRSAQAHADWALSEDYRRWQKLVALTQPALLASYPNALTTHLSQLICRSRFSTGAVAAGVTKRALRTTEFRGLTPVIHQRLTSADCPASKTIPPKLLQSLSNAVDITLDD